MLSTILIVVLVLATLGALLPLNLIRNLGRLLSGGNPVDADKVDYMVDSKDQRTTDAGLAASHNEVDQIAETNGLSDRHELPAKLPNSGAMMLDSAGVDELMGKDNQNWVSDITEGDCMRM